MAKNQFFANASHELRTPLTLVLGPLETLLTNPAQPLPAAVRGPVALAHHQAGQLNELVNRILGLTKLEAGRLPVAATVVRVWEATADGKPGLEWLLLTDLPLTELAQALVRQYASRWLIEDFHKALKNRTKVLSRGSGPSACSYRRPRASLPPWPCWVWRPWPWSSCASAAGSSPRRLGCPLASCGCCAASVSARWLRRGTCFCALAGLGGHLGRTGDGPPDWQTLWLGLMSLRQFIEGVRLATHLSLDEG